MPTLHPPDVDVTPSLLDAIRSFPTAREVSHCGVTFAASPLAVYAACPHCGQQVKVRSFAAVHELEDVFDAVLEWLNQPAAQTAARERQRELADDE